MGKGRTCGGQRRTIILGCGKRIVGHPQRINLLLKLHYKKCECCKKDKHKLNLKDVPFDASSNAVADLKSNHSSQTYDKVIFNKFNCDTGETTEGEIKNTNLETKTAIGEILTDDVEIVFVEPKE